MNERLKYASSLFSGARQDDTFGRVHEIFPVATMTASPEPFVFPQGEPIELPQNFMHEGTAKDTMAFLGETDTVALLVIKDGAMRLERYWLTGSPTTTWVSMSVAKSFVSAALGIAQAEGGFGSVEEQIVDHLPELKGSAYDGARIKDVLQMSSGARWNEDYSDPNSDINRFVSIFAHGGSFNDFAATLEREHAPGTYNLYNSTDTQVLGMLLKKVTGRPIRDYMEEKLWHPLGMEHDAHWLIDETGMEMAYGGLNATARDYAKIGELYRNGGTCGGRQIVPADWVEASVTADAPHLKAGSTGLIGTIFSYGYQWWLPYDEGEFSAIGVYNQFVYVHPGRGLVIVKLSASRNYGTTNDETSFRETETIHLFQAIGKALED
ncbi:serine hydrolase domain-containing protein [Aquibium oceanicum]|uniref:Serine hydrolase n=1 Tax=Aquibium oceanicum TaxID=1670800 RepID=A0A1L3SUA2_9HYPH|nr:serine hydrolase [Aquibium oceanicum]APH72986.1 serine hydrolase [Aquibium oceanicum]